MALLTVLKMASPLVNLFVLIFEWAVWILQRTLLKLQKVQFSL